MARARKPAHRTAQGNPILAVKCCIIAGNDTLPTDVPTAETARAKALFFSKYELRMEIAGINVTPSPMPMHTAWARKICQYVLARLVIKVPNTAKNVPTATVTRV